MKKKENYESIRQKVHKQYKDQIEDLKQENMKLKKYAVENEQLKSKISILEAKNENIQEWSKLNEYEKSVILDSIKLLLRMRV